MSSVVEKPSGESSLPRCERTILERCTVHNYAAGPIDEALVERALHAATAAPNHRMTEPWRFVRVGPGYRRRLLDIARSLKEEESGRTLPEAALAKLEKKMLNPAELIVASRVRAADPDTEREDYAACACAIYSIMLVFWEAGVGSKWSTGAVTRDPRTYELLGVTGEHEEIVAFLWAGMPDGAVPKPRRRKGQDDLVRSLP
jgi:nitroreductase